MIGLGIDKKQSLRRLSEILNAKPLQRVIISVRIKEIKKTIETRLGGWSNYSSQGLRFGPSLPQPCQGLLSTLKCTTEYFLLKGLQ